MKRKGRLYIGGWTRDCSDYSLQRREIDFSERWIQEGTLDRFFAREFLRRMTFRGGTSLIALDREELIKFSLSIEQYFICRWYYGKGGASVTIKYGEEDILIR